MKTLSFLLALAVATPAALLTATSAQAQDDDIIDLDSDGGKKKKKKKKSEAVVSSDEIVREIERGWFIKANAGMATYLLRYGAQPGGGSLIRPGSVVSIAGGQDFVDEPNRSMAWEVQFYQGVHNGMPYEIQRERGVQPADHLQGDVRTFALIASYEFSTYPSRRVGVGFRAGGGIMMVPLLMPSSLYDTTVVGTWGSNPTIHSQPHFPVYAGPTIEYYTKLSHFSVGVDIDGMFVIGMNDLAVNATGFMKYSF